MSTSVGSLHVATTVIVAMLTAHWLQATPWARAGLPAGAAQNAEQLTQGSDCASCHAVDRAVVGPAYVEIAKKYAGQPPEVATTLARRIREGGSGNWGATPMPAHADLTDAQLRDIVLWILSLKEAPASKAESTGRTYVYKLKDGQTVSVDFPLFVDGSGEKVTKEVFRGYALYNSYCYRCHGTDATESQLGPNLRRSLEAGMTTQQFLAVAMPGREDKGMPSWAGFLTEDEVTNIYRYVKGRSVGLLDVGRPASEFE